MEALENWYHTITKGQRIVVWIISIFIALVGVAIIADVPVNCYVGLSLFIPLAVCLFIVRS